MSSCHNSPEFQVIQVVVRRRMEIECVCVCVCEAKQTTCRRREYRTNPSSGRSPSATRACSTAISPLESRLESSLESSPADRYIIMPQCTVSPGHMIWHVNWPLVAYRNRKFLVNQFSLFFLTTPLPLIRHCATVRRTTV